MRKPGRIIVRTSGALLVGLVVVAAAAQFMPLQKTEIPQVRENTTVISKDGTRIAVSKLGHGRPLVLIDGARDDIEQVLASRRKLPSLCQPAPPLKARAPIATR